VQLAWFGGLSGVQARMLVPDARAIAQGEEDKAFVTYFIANSETGLDLPRFRSGRVLMLGGLLFEGHG
jgi:hypothetical protein